MTARLLRAEGYSPKVDACNGKGHSAVDQRKDELDPNAVYFQRCAAATPPQYVQGTRAPPGTQHRPGTQHSMCSGLTIHVAPEPAGMQTAAGGASACVARMV